MRVLVVDDHAIVRHGLTRLLASDGDHQVSQAVNGREALDLSRTVHPDLIILDRYRRSGAASAARADRRWQDLDPVHARRAVYARRALDAGAAGYVTKNAAPEELLTAIRRVAGGGRYVAAEVAQALALGEGADTFDALSPRELEIMRLLVQGSSLAEIAAALGLGYKTVANTLSLVKSKLGVARTAELVRLGIDTGIG